MAEESKSSKKYFELKLPRITFKDTQINTYLVAVLVIFAFLLGMLTNKVMYLEKGVSTTAAPTADQAAAPPPPTVSEDQIKNLFTDNNIVLGDKNSENLIVEIADPSCPYCQIAGGLNVELAKQAGAQFTPVSEGGTYVPPVPEIEKLVKDGKVGFVWIYSPGHGNGEMGTKALYCAHEEGKFWEVHNKLMTKAGHDLMETVVINDKAKSQELVDFLAGTTDTVKLKSCLDSGKYDNKLAEDSALATSLGVSGTPGFFVNTTNFAGAYSWKEMEASLK